MEKQVLHYFLSLSLSLSICIYIGTYIYIALMVLRCLNHDENRKKISFLIIECNRERERGTAISFCFGICDCIFELNAMLNDSDEDQNNLICSRVYNWHAHSLVCDELQLLNGIPDRERERECVRRANRAAIVNWNWIEEKKRTAKARRNRFLLKRTKIQRNLVGTWLTRICLEWAEICR